MKITDCLKPEFCILDLSAKNKEEAINEIALALESSGKVSQNKKFVQEILKRENLGSTGIGNKVAIPHARTQAVDGFVIAYGYSREGIDFAALDGEKVQMIFLMGANPSELNVYLRRLPELSKLLMGEGFRRELSEAKTPKQVIEVVRRFEQA